MTSSSTTTTISSNSRSKNTNQTEFCIIDPDIIPQDLSYNPQPVGTTKTTKTPTYELKGEREGVIYVFLYDTNMRNMHIMRQVTVERPYDLGYGQKKKVWEIVASSLTDTKINLQESLFGEAGIYSRTTKAQFMALMVWCKVWQLSKKIGSETDNEDVPNDLYTITEEEYSRYEEVLKLE